MPLKLRAIRGDLLRALGRVNKVVSDKSPMPILSHAVLRGEAESRRLLVEGTDLITGVSSVIVSEVSETGAVALPATGLHRILQSAVHDVVELTVSDEICKIQAGRSRWKIHYMPAEDHPGMPKPKAGSVPMELDGDMLRRVFFSVAYSAANNDISGEVVNSILFRNHRQILSAAATDRHRLAVAHFSLSKHVPGFEHIISQSSVAALVRFLAETQGNVTVRVSSPYVYFTRVLATENESGNSNDVTVVVKTIQGKYPPFELAIPSQEKINCRFMVSRNALGQAVRRVMATVKEKGEGVELQVVEKHLRLSYEGPVWGAGQDEIEMDLIDAPDEFESEGRSFPVRLNNQFVTEALGIIPTDNVMVSMTNTSGPLILRGVVDGEEDKSSLHVVMPILPRQKF